MIDRSEEGLHDDCTSCPISTDRRAFVRVAALGVAGVLATLGPLIVA